MLLGDWVDDRPRHKVAVRVRHGDDQSPPLIQAEDYARVRGWEVVRLAYIDERFDDSLEYVYEAEDGSPSR
jgi:hypothetical protein